MRVREVPESTSRLLFASPERGLLIQSLVGRRVSIDQWTFNPNEEVQLPVVGAFAYADLRNLTLSPIVDSNINQYYPRASHPVSVSLCADVNKVEAYQTDSPYSDTFARLSESALPNALLSGALLQNIALEGGES